MCELFGFSGPARRRLNRPLEEFFSHSPQHPNGWGLALLDGSLPEIDKEPLAADRSAYLRARLREPVLSSFLLAHIRYATIGSIERRNCHPFTGLDAEGRRWTLIHNGTVFDSPELEDLARVQEGETDSERILLQILRLMDRERAKAGRPLSEGERFRVLDRFMVSLSGGNKINLLISDGDLLYVHTNQEGTLFYRSWEKGTLFSTSPLFPDLWDWKQVPMTRLLAYRKGSLAYVGADHGRVYVPDPDRIRLLYLSFSGL